MRSPFTAATPAWTLVLGLGFVLAACAPTAREALGPQLALARAAGQPVLIYAFGVPGQISVGASKSAVPVYVQFVVTSPQSLKNVRFTLSGYSARGIAVRGHDGGHLKVLLLGPGPFEPENNYEVNSFHSRPAGFPGGDVACVELTAMEVTYADGRRATYSAARLDPLLVAALRGRCEDQGPQVNALEGGS